MGDLVDQELADKEECEEENEEIDFELVQFMHFDRGRAITREWN